MTINELREIFNLAPIENGDIIMQDVNHNIMGEDGNIIPIEGDGTDEGEGN